MNKRKKIKIGFEAKIYLLGNDGPKAFIKRLRSSIKAQKIAKAKSVILPFYDIGLFKSTNKSIYKKPYVLRVDGIYYDTKETLGPNEKLNRPIFESIENASGIVYISNFSKRLIETFFKKIDKPYIIIHNAVDTNQFNPRGEHHRKRLGIENYEKVIITSAHWRKWKRLEDTVKLFLELLKNDGDHYRLVVLGGNPDYVVEHKKIHYIGEVKPSELASWYRTGDVYIHLAWLEACGNTQVEAMACGLPVLCTNLGGIGETVRKADGGIVSEADAPYHFQPVDLYNPPKPKHDVLLRDLKKIIDNLELYRNRIKFVELSIDSAAIEYCNFISELFFSKESSNKNIIS